LLSGPAPADFFEQYKRFSALCRAGGTVLLINAAEARVAVNNSRTAGILAALK
jgi:hypothetical protein